MASLTTSPPEVILQIISYLPHIHHLYAISLSCRRLRGLADCQLYLLAARKHPYLLCWACGIGDARLVERLLDAGVDPNRPFRVSETIEDFGWGWDLTGDPVKALDNIYHHSLWNGVYSNAYPQSYCDDLSRVDNEAYDPGFHTDLLAYKSGPGYWFPLHAASMRGCDTIVRLLLERGAHSNAPSVSLCSCEHDHMVVLPGSTGEDGPLEAPTPIHIAVCHEKNSTVRLLLSLGSTITADLCYPKTTIFHQAASRGNVFVMKLLLDRQLASIDAHDHLGETPLIRALEEPHAVRWLLKHGADANYPTKDGCTPLHIACYYGWYQTAKKLIKAGASIDTSYRGGLWSDLEFTSPHDLLPITFACTNHYADKNPWSWPRGFDTEVSYISYNEDMERQSMLIVKKLLAVGFDNPRCTSELQTALLAATAAHRTSLMELIVEAGADVSGVTKIGRRVLFPLLIAVQSGRSEELKVKSTETIRWLLERGANINQVDEEGDGIGHHVDLELGRETFCSIVTLLREYGIREDEELNWDDHY